MKQMSTRFHSFWKNSSKNQRRVIYVCIAFIVLALIGISDRLYKEHLLRKHTEQNAVLNVATIAPLIDTKHEEILLPGNVLAWHEATIYARTNGYIKEWYTDIGARVKEGDILAVIQAPEVDAKLVQAQADLKMVQAELEIAKITDVRWKNLLKTESVSQQEADEKASAAKASDAQVAAAKANVDYLQSLVNFQKIIAPFDGVITLRNIDIGSLINAGSNSTEMPLFNIVQSDRLRLYVDIPQRYTARLTENMQVKLYFNEYPSKTYDAVLMSTASGIDQDTRTLLAEFMVDNSQYELLPGSYTQVHLFLPVPNTVVRIPVNTLLFRAQGLQVGVVNEQGIVTLKSIDIGRDFGTEVEVVSGINVEDAVIVNPSDSLANGQQVNVVQHAKS